MSERRGPPNVDGMTTLKVDNISYNATNDSLRAVFSPYGEIGDIYIPRNREDNEIRGFAFVRFNDKKDADDAQRALDGTEVDGRTLAVMEAKQRRPDFARGGGGGYDRGGRDRDDRNGGGYRNGGGDYGRDRGGYGDRGGDRNGYGREERGGDRDRGDRYGGGDRYASNRDDRDYRSDRGGDRGGDQGAERGGDRGGDRGGYDAPRRGGSRDRGSDRGTDRGAERGGGRDRERSRSRSPARGGGRY